jgi:hypothetical protein
VAFPGIELDDATSNFDIAGGSRRFIVADIQRIAITELTQAPLSPAAYVAGTE